MAKKKRSKRVKSKTPVGEAIALIIPPLVREVLSHEAAVRAGDVEGVHDMRVATKRLREAARVFRPVFGRSRMAPHIERLEALNDALGVVRELDVLGAQLQELGAQDGGVPDGLQPLISELAGLRRDADRELTPVLDETLPNLKRDFRELLGERSKKRKATRKMPFARFGQAQVAKRVAAFLELEGPARDPKSVSEFHRMRIAVKKAKYALELFVDVLRKPARKSHKSIAKLQEIMGAVHDCDVLMAIIQQAEGDVVKGEIVEGALRIVRAERDRLHGETLALLDRQRRD